MNIWGPSPTTAYDDIKYLLTIVDDATRWVEMLPLKLKSDAYQEYIKYTTHLFTNYDIKIKMLQSDNDTVFLSQDFTNYLDSQGTQRRLTVHNTPQQNDVVEHMHQTIFNGVRVSLLDSKLSTNL